MRIVFAGTPPFAATALQALIDASQKSADFDIVLVLTQPDRPAGRGMKLAPNAVKQVALDNDLEVATPPSLGLKRGGVTAEQAHAKLHEAAPDVLVVAAYGLILPQAVLDIPSGLPDAGCGPITAINIHASLLPRWRGAAPVTRAIEAGDVQTGTTIMQMDAGLDTGPMLLQASLPIGPLATTATLTDQLAEQGARMIVDALRAATRRELRATPQPVDGVTYAHKIEKREAWLDFRRPARELARRVRAFDPFPGAAALWRAVPLKLWQAASVDSPPTDGRPVVPGTVVRADARGVLIECGHGLLCVSELQRAGGRRLHAREFLAGTPIAAGDLLQVSRE